MFKLHLKIAFRNLWMHTTSSVINVIGLAGVPLACYFMNRWLSHFEFRTTIFWWIIATAVSGTFLIALVTISYQAYKTATGNLVNALKYE